MNMTAMRAQFESWLERINHYRPDITLGSQSHWYSDPKVEEAWSIWQASRASLVIELPPRQEVSPMGGDGVYVRDSAAGDWMDADAVLAAVEAAGVKALSF